MVLYDLHVCIKGIRHPDLCQNYQWLKENEVKDLVGLSRDEFMKKHDAVKGGKYEFGDCFYEWKRRDDDPDGPMSKWAKGEFVKKEIVKQSNQEGQCSFCGKMTLINGYKESPEEAVVYSCPSCAREQRLGDPLSDTALLCPDCGSIHGAGPDSFCGDPKAYDSAKSQPIKEDCSGIMPMAVLKKKANMDDFKSWWAASDEAGDKLSNKIKLAKDWKELFEICNAEGEEWSLLLESYIDDTASIPVSKSTVPEPKTPGEITSSISKEADPIKYKKLNIRPKDVSPEDVQNAIEPTETMKMAYSDLKASQNSLASLERLLADVRAKYEEAKAKAEKAGQRLEQETKFKRSVDGLSQLIVQAQTKVVNFGDMLVAYVQKVGKKSMPATDAWRVEKLLSKYGEDARKYLEAAERGLQSKAPEQTVSELIEFEQKEHAAHPESHPAALSKKDLEIKAEGSDLISTVFDNLKHFVFETSNIMTEFKDLMGELEPEPAKAYSGEPEINA